MGQPPNLRELISSGRRRHLLGQLREGEARARLRAARAWKRACAQTLEADDRFPARRPPEPPCLHARHRRRAPRAPARDRLLGGRRRPGRSRAGVLAARPLLAALGDEQPRALLLTHIHLDHAAATGALVRRWPELEVYVHERGAPHLIDPSKLLASAERLYGDQMERLWGEIVPVPEANVRPLSGGETVLGMRVAYTPGHASHHVCYLHEETGTAFVGDVAAVRIPPSNLVVPAHPAAGHRHRDLGGLDRDRSRPGSPSASPSPTSARSRTRPSTCERSASACARRPSWPASCPRTSTSAAIASGSKRATSPGDRRRADPVRAAPVPVARPRPLLAQEGRARSGLVASKSAPGDHDRDRQRRIGGTV